MLMGTFGGGFRWDKIVIWVWYNYKKLSHPFHHGGGWDGMDFSRCIWMTLTKIDAMGAYSLLGAFGRGFG